jgi:hypothetical protein
VTVVRLHGDDSILVVAFSLSVKANALPTYMQTRGLTHFEDHIVGFTASAQPVEWKVQNYGVFLQMSLKLGPYSVIDVH